jgi:hypothetical protein
MSRLERLREYAKPQKGAHGSASYKPNIDYWSERATANSLQGTRAKDGPMELPSTGKKMATRDTEMKPRSSRKIDRQMAGRDDPNRIGDSDYLKGIRRT